jgi:hypothetical protein
MAHLDHILCADDDRGLRESRCAILDCRKYHSVSASIQFADILLSYQKFDLVVLSTVNDRELDRLLVLAQGSDILVLSAFTKPDKLLSMVAGTLERRHRKLA